MKKIICEYIKSSNVSRKVNCNVFTFILAGFSLLLILCFLLQSCHQKTMQKYAAMQRHWIEITQAGVGILYLDTVPSKNVVTTEIGNTSKYVSFLFGVSDSVFKIRKDREAAEDGKYYNYAIERDLFAISGPDTLKPVFFHPKIELSQQTHESVIVFELPQSTILDTLVYNDSYGSWGIKKFILNER